MSPCFCHSFSRYGSKSVRKHIIFRPVVSSQSSRAWLDRQLKDPYVRKAQDLALPSRAYFKLEEINEALFYSAISKKGKNSYRQLIQPNMTVLDLGAAPGGWSIYASSKLNSKSGGSIVSVDLLSLNSDVIARINANTNGRSKFIQGDFSHYKIQDEIKEALGRLSKGMTRTHSIEHHKANLIISDMAANFTGDSLTDAIRTMNLCEQSLGFAAGGRCFDASYSPHQVDHGMLAKNGSFLCKYFSCGKENERDFMNAAKRVFKTIHLLKPKSSRKESSEMYLLGYNKR